MIIDSDLATIYGYETRAFNQQVKRNIEKFEGEDFMLQLNEVEVDEFSRCQNVTLNKKASRGSNIKYNPYAFIEQGIYILNDNLIHN
ncbi:MAG: ORF6N domain-containing protein [Tissierellia bacterium]|nr:ORF6N domain-containing protein [Tissierellia bacterium]